MRSVHELPEGTVNRRPGRPVTGNYHLRRRILRLLPKWDKRSLWVRALETFRVLP